MTSKTATTQTQPKIVPKRSRFNWTAASDDALIDAERRLLAGLPITAHQVPLDDARHMNVLLSNAPDLASLKSSPQPPIVLLAGFGAGAAMWWKNHAHIAQTTQRPVIAVDLLGFGRSSRPQDFPKDSAVDAEKFFVDSLRELLFDKLALNQIVLVGHSLGGFLSASFAMQHRAHIDKLVLVSPVGVPRRPDNYVADTGRNSRLFRFVFGLWDRGVTPQQLVRIAGPRGPQMVRSAVTRRFWTVDRPEEREALSDYVYQISAHPASGEHAMNSILQAGAFARLPLVDRIDALDKKLDTLFLYGEQDWMDPTLPIQWVTDGAHAKWQLRFVPNAGHQLFIEQPADFNEICSSFIAGTLEPREIVRRRVRRTNSARVDNF